MTLPSDHTRFWIKPATAFDHPRVVTDGPATVIVRLADGAGIIIAHRWTGQETDFWAELNWFAAEVEVRRQTPGAFR